jgi:hypothetical protein
MILSGNWLSIEGKTKREEEEGNESDEDDENTSSALSKRSRVATSEINSFYSAEFEEFLKNPTKFEATDEDLQKIQEEDAEWYELDKTIDWEFVDKNGNTCILHGYLSGKEIMIEQFDAIPERQGVGRRCLRYIKSKLQPLDYSVNQITATDESKDFWEKMFNEGLLNY